MIELLSSRKRIINGSINGNFGPVRNVGARWSSGMDGVVFSLEGNATTGNLVDGKYSLNLPDYTSALVLNFDVGLELPESWQLEMSVKGPFTTASNNVFMSGLWPSGPAFQLQYYKSGLYTYFNGPFRTPLKTSPFISGVFNKITWRCEQGVHHLLHNDVRAFSLVDSSRLVIPAGSRLEFPMRSDGRFIGQIADLKLTLGDI